MQHQHAQVLHWRTPEELAEIGFSRSRVVMMNEAHSGDQRCIRTRLIGQRLLPALHRLGVRHLAMEALYTRTTDEVNRTRQIRGDQNIPAERRDEFSKWNDDVLRVARRLSRSWVFREPCAW